MKMKYVKERLSDVRCGQTDCWFHSKTHEQWCSGKVDGNPATRSCVRYKPLQVKRRPNDNSSGYSGLFVP
jgi:hypothetical protein